MPAERRNRKLLFLPGAGADPRFWRPVGDLLPQHWDKQYLGWPGIGHNPPQRGIASFEDLVGLAEERLVQLSREGTPVDIIAQSMGGAVALALALAQADKIGSLVLAVTAGGMDVESFGAMDWRPGYREEYPKAAPWLYAARPNFSSDLGRIFHPTLLLFGDDDPISPPAVGEEFQRRMPNASLVILAGGSHALATERAEEVAKLVLQHLTGG